MMINNRRSEQGSVLILILITVALFAALSFAYTRMGDGNKDLMSEGEAKIAAAEILDHAKDVERAVNRILLKGVSDQDICFASDQWEAGFETNQYDHGDCNSDNQVFSSTGGGVKWVAPNPDWMDQTTGPSWGRTRWVYTGDDRIIGVGSDSNSELLVMLAPVKREICEEINKSVGVEYDFDVNDYPCCGYDAARIFGIGSSGSRYHADKTIGDQDTAYAGKLTGCGYGESPAYHYFWHVVIPR